MRRASDRAGWGNDRRHTLRTDRLHPEEMMTAYRRQGCRFTPPRGEQAGPGYARAKAQEEPQRQVVAQHHLRETDKAGAKAAEHQRPGAQTPAPPRAPPV